MKLKNLIKDSLISLGISFAFIAGFELFLRFSPRFKQGYSGNEFCKIYNPQKDYSYYKSNCLLLRKDLENPLTIEYLFNEDGRREISYTDEIYDENSIKVATVGDSFTLGAMNPIHKNYNFYGLNTLRNYIVHNYAVAGEDFTNIINKINDIEIDNYDVILYGLTPNDLFEFLENKNQKVSSLVMNENKNNPEEFGNFNYRIIYFVRDLLLSTRVSKFVLHKLISNPNIYYSIYENRKPYSEYLEEDLSQDWIYALEKFEEGIGDLPTKIKEKFKIYILPQRAEVIGEITNNNNGTSFKKKILETCTNLEIKCNYPSLKKLSIIKQSHFPIDGHLTIEGNKLVGEDLAKWSKEW